MSNSAQINPFDYFADKNGDALDEGYIWIGQPNKDPRQFPVSIFFDAAMTIPAAQPLRTNAGYVVRGGAPAEVYVSGTHSILVEDKKHLRVWMVNDASDMQSSVVVNSIAELRQLVGAPSGKAFVYGYYKKGDGGGGNYYVDESDTTSPDNGGTIIVGDDGSRWKLVWNGVVRIRQFGAKLDGVTQDHVAVQSAINSGAKKVIFDPGVCGIGVPGLIGVSDQVWEGEGIDKSTIKALVPPTKDFVFFDTKSNFSITGITFDGNGMLTAGSGNFPTLLPCVHLSVPDNFNVSGNKFVGFYNCGLLTNIATHGSINYNILNRGGFDSFINHGIAASAAVGAESYDLQIIGNKCYFCQISVNCHDTIISDNLVTRWGFSAGINTQAISICYNLIITNNTCFNPQQANDASNYSPAGIENWAPNSVISGNICFQNFGEGIDNGGGSCIISDNTLFDNRGYGLYNLYQDATYNASNTLVHGNKMYDTRQGGFRYQVAGYAEQVGGLTGIMFADNVTTNNIGPNVFNCTDRTSSAQYDWITVTVFQNGWVDYGGGTFAPVSYYKDADGFVHLRGAIKSGTVGVVAFTLPVGFRPATLTYTPCVSNNLFGMLIILPSGGVTLQAGNNAYAALDCISFRSA